MNYEEIRCELTRELRLIDKGQKSVTDIAVLLVAANRLGLVEFERSLFDSRTTEGRSAILSIAVEFLQADLITKSTLLSRGWTAAIVEEFYPEPDLLKVNPHYRCAAAMCLYFLPKVERLESSGPAKAAIALAFEKRISRIRKAKKKRELEERIWLDAPRVPGFRRPAAFL